MALSILHFCPSPNRGVQVVKLPPDAWVLEFTPNAHGTPAIYYLANAEAAATVAREFLILGVGHTVTEKIEDCKRLHYLGTCRDYIGGVWTAFELTEARP